MKNNNEKIVVKAKDLHKKYKVGKVFINAVKNISFDIKKGSFSLFVGESGCGKTTTLNLIGGLTPATSGMITIHNEIINNFTDKKLSQFRNNNIGFIFQDFNLIDVYSVYENIAYPLYLAGILRKERFRRVKDMLEKVKMSEYLKHKPTELSGGQKQRVAIARALINNPEIVLADEPTANLDSKTSTVILDLMKDLNEKLNTTFIVASHSPRMTKYASEIFTMQDGLLTDN